MTLWLPGFLKKRSLVLSGSMARPAQDSQSRQTAYLALSRAETPFHVSAQAKITLSSIYIPREELFHPFMRWRRGDV